MGVRFLVLLIALVPLASSRDLRTASTVNRRTAPDPLLVQLFNDPTATSQLTKKLLDGSDDGSASGSGLWAASGDGPKASDDTTAKTVTKPNPVKLVNDDATVWANSGSGSGALPATKTEDETVETKDDSVANVDVNAKKSSFIPSGTQTVTDQVEEGNNVRDSTAAPKGDANDMYDATVVKKNEVPKPDDATATGKSVVVHTPEGGLFPLTSDQSAQQQSQDLSQMTAQPQQDMAQVAAQPLQDMSQAAAQPLQDMSQAAVQPQQVSPQPDMSQYAMQPQQDMPQDAQQQDAAPPQMMAPNMANSTLYQGAPLQSNDQGYGQYQDPSQAGAYTQDSNQDPSMDQPSVQGQAAVNPYASQDYFGNQLDPQTGLPIAGMQQVPVFKGLKAKKIDIKEDECEDMYDACPDMAKNKYCTKFSDLMHVQCKKSCGFCQVKDEASGDSGSGSAMWNDLPQEDNEIPIWRKSGIPSPGDKVVVGESGSGSAIAADAWSNSASGENMIKGEADAVADDEPAPAEKNESAVADTLESSGSGQQSTSEEFGSGANLAEDLATGTVSKAEQDTSETKETNESEETTEPKSKYSEIPGTPQVIIQQQPAAEVYPHIDLKTIAKAVDAYKSTALRMLGEAIRDSAQEAENKASKRTSIPMPPANELLKKMGFPMDQPRSQMRELEYPFAPYWQTMAAQQEAAAARAKIAKAKEDARKKAKAEAEAKAKKLKEDQEASGDLDDPYMYVRHMPKGASMQPIESHPGASNTPHGHSNPIILFKNSQISNAVAAKKNAIPKPSVSKFLMQQMPQAAPAARSGVEQPMFNPMETAPSNEFIQDSNLEMPANSTQGYVQQTPLGDNQMMNSFNADSQAALVQPQPQAGGLNMAASFFNQQPMPSPHADVNILPESNSYFANQPNQEMATAQVGGKEQTKSSISDEAISGHSPEVSDEHSDDSLYHSLADELSSSDVKKTLESNGKGPMAEISGKIPKKSNVFAAINDIDDISKEDVGPPPDDLSNSEPAQQRGVLPPLNYGKNLPPLNHGMESASNLPPLNHGMGSSLPPLNYGTEAAKNLPPLNHGAELPPLNHGKEFAANLPPLNHEMKTEALPPLNHGMESASNLPPLLKGVEQEKIIQPFAKTGDSVKSYHPPIALPPLEHAQSSPEMNLFYSNPADTEGSRYMITSDQTNNGLQSSPGTTNFVQSLNQNQLPPLKYASVQAAAPPIYPYSIPPEGATQSQSYAGNGNGGIPQIGPILFPEGGHPFPEPFPPEGNQQDQLSTKGSAIGKKNLIRPKPDLKCGSGWTGAYGDFGTFCYQLSFDKSTWNDARKSCVSAGGDLFSVTNAYEQRFLENFTNSEAWIGYRDKSLAGTWSWSDGSKSVYSDWDSSAKDDHGKGRDCVVLDSDEGKWRDDSCSQKYSFLCKKSADDCNEGWKKLTLNSVRGCYKFNEDKKTWDEAQQACLNDEGALASILSDDEQTMVSQVYSKHDMWIGYNDKDNEGDWVWPDRMTSSYTNWDDKSPNNGGVTCAIITRTGRWHDEPCQSKYSYLCKKPSPKTLKDLQNDGILTQKVNDFIADNNLVPNIDTSVSIFGRQAVSPRYFWTAQKIYNNKIHGSSPISIHGHIKSVDGGLQLNGVDSWLDAGDFYGQCLGDPDLCIKGFSFAMQLNFDDDAKSYKDKRYIMDSAGDSRGISIYLENSTVHYKVVTSSKTWDLSTDLVTNDWQDVVLTWKKEEGLMLYVNGAFRDSQKDGTATNPVPNKQARLTVGRKSGNPPYRYTRMYISSLYAFTRFLSPEDIPYVFTYDDTVTARYTWLLPELRDGKVEGSPEIEVNGPVKAVDGGVFIDGTKSYLKVGDFQGRCISDPTKCPHGLSLSYKLKLNRKVRTYKERRYIMDSGGHVSGNKGIAAYINNNNLYFTLAMSTPDDTLRWTVRTSIFTVRWQRVVLTWSVKKGLWLYIDGQFRGLTSTPKTIPRDEVEQNSEFIIGRRNIGDDYKPAEFSIGSLSIFKRFLDKKDVSKVFGEKKMPYPGLIREVWKELPGKDLSKLKEDPYYPNDPSLVEIIENFDAPFDVEKDFGSRVKGYFVAPETGNYTFYLSGSKSTELWLSKGESQQNMSSMIALHDSTGHNQWNKFTAQISKSVRLEAGKYYYIIALEKGTESTDSLSAGVRLPSGRFMRPVSKEMLQWRLPGDPFAGVIREVWQDVAGYKITDLTSNKNFPNNPSSIEVLDKFDAPHNIDDNYGARVRGYFKAPEDGKYRFYLAADTTGELWLSTDESENNVRKIITLNGWTAHNQWLKFPEQKSEHVKLKKGRYYYFEVYHKADKLADCASVAVEFPSGHFEGPIKRVHLSWRLPDGITGPGPSSEEEAVPKPAGLYPLNDQYTANDASGNNDNGVLRNVKLVDGPDGKPNGAYEFSGSKDSYIEIPKSNVLDTKNSITLLANVYPTGNGGPIINYKTDGWGVHLWQFESNELFVRFVHRNGVFHKPIGSRVIQKNTWNQVGATYDNTTGVARLWHNGKMVKSRNIGRIRLMTQYPVRIGARDGDERRFTGKISCVQIYRKALDQQQIGNLKQCPVKASADEESSGSGSGLSALLDSASADHTGVSISHQAGKYDKDEEADDLIQGSEFVTGAKKCDPNPCENYGKCIKDAKRLDGYRCKCSSDFTGRNCQVSKPDAENPVVKRTKIPKAEKKEGSEKYQKNTTSNGVIEQMREEKKEDVLLLFQKLGCYKDEMTRHDIPNKVTLKAVSQEDCVRACALKEQGYSYFGLQNSDQCYCGHKYGRYGKSDDALCNKRCNGNNDENCGGNSTNMVYFFGLGTNYTVNVYTGDKEDSDSDAKVYITLYGDKGDSGFRKLGTNAFTKKQTVSETMLLPELGDLKKVRILHDNSGKHPSWFLNKVTVTDENGKVYNFPCHEWLSETRGGGKTERLLFADNTNQS